MKSVLRCQSKPMTKHLKKRGRHLELPIIGANVAEVRIAIDRLVELIFRDSTDPDRESVLMIEEAIILSRGKATQTLEGARPGSAFAPHTLHPLVELIGCTITEAVAQEDGPIRIDLSNAMQFTVESDGYEGWHFNFTSKRTPVDNFTLRGAGSLIHF